MIKKLVAFLDASLTTLAAIPSSPLLLVGFYFCQSSDYRSDGMVMSTFAFVALLFIGTIAWFSVPVAMCLWLATSMAVGFYASKNSH